MTSAGCHWAIISRLSFSLGSMIAIEQFTINFMQTNAQWPNGLGPVDTDPTLGPATFFLILKHHNKPVGSAVWLLLVPNADAFSDQALIQSSNFYSLCTLVIRDQDTRFSPSHLPFSISSWLPESMPFSYVRSVFWVKEFWNLKTSFGFFA